MKSFPDHRKSVDQVRTIFGVLGVYLLIFGLAAVFWSARAAVGQARYAAVLMHPSDPERELSLIRRAFRMYPKNYAICIRGADTAFKASEAADDKVSAERFRNEAEYWVGRGINLNPRLMELHYLKARLLARHDPEAAVEVWKAYTDWHFWEPRNLEILARFQEGANRDREALQTLQVLKAWPEYDSWRMRIEARLETNAPGFIQPARPGPARL